VPDERTLVFVCHGPSCSERGSAETCRRLRETLLGGPNSHGVRVCETSCLDHCATGPNVVIGHSGRLISGQLPEEASRLAEFLAGGRQSGT
jgi:NADH:ubiquinone oxidoreductase subunit E